MKNNIRKIYLIIALVAGISMVLAPVSYAYDFSGPATSATSGTSSSSTSVSTGGSSSTATPDQGGNSGTSSTPTSTSSGSSSTPTSGTSSTPTPDQGGTSSGGNNNGGSSTPTPDQGGSGGGNDDNGSAPSVTTGSYNVNGYTATIYGTVSANGSSTTYYLKYRSQGGSWATVNSGTVSGSTAGHTVSASFGVSANTYYEYFITATNSVNTRSGNVNGFSVGSNGGGGGNGGGGSYSNGWTPNVSTFRVENVTQTSADVFGRVNPNGSYTEYWFEYGTDNSFNRQTSHWHLNAMNGESDVSLMIGNLNPGTSYNVRLIASNGYGTNNGAVLSFTTLGSGSPVTGNLPIVATFSASDISRNTAILHAKVSPAGSATSIWFEYGTSAANLGKMTTVQNVGGDYNYRSFTSVARGLSAGTTYYYRVAAASTRGTTYGAILTFRTLSYAPVNPGTPVVTIDNSDDAATALDVMLDPSVSRLEPSAGEEFDYTLTYRNASKNALGKTVIKVSLPLEVDLIDTNVKPSVVSGNILSFEIGEVAKNSQGIITVRVKVKPEVSGGSTLMFNSFMEYTDAMKKFQSINSYISVSVKGDPEATADNGGFLGSLAGFAKIMSGSWLLVILLILILIALIYLVVTRRRDRLNS